MQRDRQFLLDILQSSKLIQNYTSRVSRDEFDRDTKLQDAVIRRLLIIGEAGRRISETTRQTLKNIPWTDINGMRNRLVHEYEEVDLNVVWEVIRDDLPSLIEEIKLVFPDEDDRS